MTMITLSHARILHSAELHTHAIRIALTYRIGTSSKPNLTIGPIYVHIRIAPIDDISVLAVDMARTAFIEDFCDLGDAEVACRMVNELKANGRD